MTVAHFLKLRISTRQKDLIEYTTDFLLVIFSIVYWFAIDVTGWQMSAAVSAKTGIAGGTARMLFRRILLRLVDTRLDSRTDMRTEAEKDPAASDPEAAISTLVEPIVPPKD